ncbi:dethiobiotin synthase [Marinoscillum furvescens]|uniref:ATP-dependent dethiobiotin synthetase BioD n=1 Tax=Marinoscillum furvescens DSM 4134 TaxID=1122208 RepID=A0A3D9KYQ7_MARFU|nr:dethiobiotin synthase [Marinoscillum furvescens]RED92471.1 dethiobiotin synthetase [Marinoscillum furvescens DSM 4134]
MNYFVTAIDTDSGKTLVSAILTEMLKADYWKPVQSGEPRDTETVQSLVANDQSNFYKEAYLLKTPASPHASAAIDGVHIDLDQIVPPVSNRDLVVEGAGGVLVPLNDDDVVADIIPRVAAEVVLVSNLYLGSINHTLLTCEYLKAKGYPVKGIIFNGKSNPESERIILLKSGYRQLLKIEREEEITKEVVKKYAEQLRKCWD